LSRKKKKKKKVTSEFGGGGRWGTGGKEVKELERPGGGRYALTSDVEECQRESEKLCQYTMSNEKVRTTY